MHEYCTNNLITSRIVQLRSEIILPLLIDKNTLFFSWMQYEVCHTFDTTKVQLLYFPDLQYTRVRNPDLDLSQIILIDVANYAPLDLVAATTMVRDKVRTVAHPNICMMMPCFRANLPHRSDFAMLDRLIDLVLGSSPRAGLDGDHGGAVQKWHSRNLPRPRCTGLPFGMEKPCATRAEQIPGGSCRRRRGHMAIFCAILRLSLPYSCPTKLFSELQLFVYF